jgi:hypothetical protein
MSDYGDEDVDYDFTWNHRVLKTTSEFEGILEENYTIVECHYRNGEPSSCCDPFLTGDSIEDLRALLAKMKSALEKPVILMKDLDSFTDLDILVHRNKDEDDNA